MAGRKEVWPPTITVKNGKEVTRLWVGNHRQQFILGPVGSPQAKAEYARILAEFAAKGSVHALAQHTNYTVTELVAQYLEEKPREDSRAAHRLARALSRLTELYGHTIANEFSPRGITTLQHTWIEEGLSRRYVQHLAKEVRAFFRWGVSEEYVAASIADALWYVGLLARDAVPFRPRVRPVEEAALEQTLPVLPRIVGAMVRLQRWTGMRPGEICALRPCDVDRDWKSIDGVKVWLYKLDEHKNDWRGHYRWIPLGPRGQAILLPFLERGPEAYCFSPREVAEEWLRERQRAVKFCRRRAPGLRYNGMAYAKVIRGACDRVDRLMHADRSKAGKAVLGSERLFPRWSPNRIRHLVGTVIETELGREDARCALGHKHASTTAIYAEQVERAARVFARFG